MSMTPNPPGQPGGSSPGTRLGFASITSDVTAITAIQDVAGLSFAVTGTGRPIRLAAHVSQGTASIAAVTGSVHITDDANVIIGTCTNFHTAVGADFGYTVVAWVEPAFGDEVTYKVRAESSGAGELTLSASSSAPAILEAVAA